MKEKEIPTIEMVLNIATIQNIFRDVAQKEGVSKISCSVDSSGTEFIIDDVLFSSTTQYPLRPLDFQRDFKYRKEDCQGFLMSLIRAAKEAFLREHPGKNPFKYAEDGVSFLDASEVETVKNSKELNASIAYVNSLGATSDGTAQTIEVKEDVPFTNDNILCDSNLGILDGQHRMRWLELFLNNQIAVQNEDFFKQGIEVFSDALSLMPMWKNFLGLTFNIKVLDTTDRSVCSEKFVEINNGAKKVSKREEFFALFSYLNSVKIARRLYSDKKYAKAKFGKYHMNILKKLLCKTPLDTLYKAFVYYTDMVYGYKNDQETVNDSVNGDAVKQEQRFWKIFSDCSEEEFFGHMNGFLTLFAIIGEYSDIVDATHGRKIHLTNAVVKKVYEQCVSKVSKNNRFGFKSLPENYETIARKYLDKNHSRISATLDSVYKDNSTALDGTPKDFALTDRVYREL